MWGWGHRRQHPSTPPHIEGARDPGTLPPRAVHTSPKRGLKKPHHPRGRKSHGTETGRRERSHMEQSSGATAQLQNNGQPANMWQERVPSTSPGSHCCLPCPSRRGKLKPTFKIKDQNSDLSWQNEVGTRGVEKSPLGHIAQLPRGRWVKPGLEGWESFEKPEKTLRKCSHGGGGLS